MLIAVAIVGWLLFLFTLVLYRVGNRLNSAETNALALFSLALMLSDDFRDPIRSGYEKAICDANDIEPTPLTFRLMLGVTETAKGYDPRHARGPLETDSISVILNEIKIIQG